ncbi:MAG TPA: MXAN_5187 C-terminal domain-containing protein [Vicinamibacterales bacterium]|nr:MXAN_5187 C-terminal domain-containing protein [Vicinamibacterales bacterium]
MAEPPDLQRDLEVLASDLKRLEAEYNMFFAGRLPRPPWETRGRVQALIKRYDRGQIQGTGDRFRFEMLQARFQSLIDLWDRGMRAREEGRPGPFAPPPPKAATKQPAASPGQVVHVTAFKDAAREIDKLHTLYDSLMDVRRQNGEDVVPFHKFAALVQSHVTKLRQAGNSEVAFRVAVKDGKAALTVRGLKGPGE